MTEPFSFPQHNEESRIRAGVRDTPGDYLAGCFLSIHRLQVGDSQVLCKRGCKGGVGVGMAPELFTTWTSWIHLTISPSRVRGGPQDHRKISNQLPDTARDQCAKQQQKSIYKQEFCPAYSANTP